MLSVVAISIREACQRRTSFSVLTKVFRVLNLKKRLSESSVIRAIFAASFIEIF